MRTIVLVGYMFVCFALMIFVCASFAAAAISAENHDALGVWFFIAIAAGFIYLLAANIARLMDI